MLSQIGSFRPHDIADMQKLDAPTICLDDSFTKKIIQKEVEGEEIQMEDLTGIGGMITIP